MTNPFLAIFDIGWMELSAIAGVALLFFGNRLPDMGKHVGQFIVQFKRGLRDVDKELTAVTAPAPTLDQPKSAASIGGEYKFDPYTGKPIGEKSDQKQA